MTNIVTAILRNKISALILGTSGMGVISQLTSLNSFVTFFGTLGFPIGLTKFVSQWEKENKWDEIYSILRFVIFLLLSLSALLIIAALFFSINISQLILDSSEYNILIIICFLSFPFIFVTTSLDAFLRGLKRFDLYVNVSLKISLFTFLINIVLILLFGLNGFVYGILITAVVSVIIFLLFLHKKKLIDIKRLFVFRLERTEVIDKMVLLGLGSLIIGVVQQFSILYIRSIIIKDLGLDANGLYQSVYSISNNYFSVFFMAIGIYALPILSENSNRDAVNGIINDHFKFVFILIVPLVSFIFVFRDFILQLLFSSSFLTASNLFFYNFLGDYFKALAWVSGLWLIPNMKVKAWVIFDLILNFNFILIFLILVKYTNVGLISVTIAYFVSNLVHFLLNFWFVKTRHTFKMYKRNSHLFVSSTITLLIIMFLSEYNRYVGYFIIIPLLFIWTLISFKKQDFITGWDFLKEKMNLIKHNNQIRP